MLNRVKLIKIKHPQELFHCVREILPLAVGSLVAGCLAKNGMKENRNKKKKKFNACCAILNYSKTPQHLLHSRCSCGGDAFHNFPHCNGLSSKTKTKKTCVLVREMGKTFDVTTSFFFIEISRITKWSEQHFIHFIAIKGKEFNFWVFQKRKWNFMHVLLLLFIFFYCFC